MDMVKVFYPGPSVTPDEADREQVHTHLGIIKPGWNDVADDANTMAAIEAGLVSLEQPESVPPPVPPVNADNAPDGAFEE